MELVKKCNGCKLVLTTDNFRPKNGGLAWLCKECERNYKNSWCAKNRKKINARERARVNANRETINARRRAIYQESKTKVVKSPQ